MNLCDFNKGSQEEQANWIWQDGVLLANRIDQGHKVSLYHMGEFYVEVYCRTRDNQVEFVRGFKNEDFLSPYQDNLKLRFDN